MSHGVVDQIGHRLRQQAGLGLQQRQAGRTPQPHRNARPAPAHARDGGGQDVLDRLPLLAQLGLGLRQARRLQHVVGHEGQVQRLLFEVGQQALALRRGHGRALRAQGTGTADQRRQRCAQIVRQRSQQGVACCLGAGDVFGLAGAVRRTLALDGGACLRRQVLPVDQLVVPRPRRVGKQQLHGARGVATRERRTPQRQLRPVDTPASGGAAVVHHPARGTLVKGATGAISPPDQRAVGLHQIHRAGKPADALEEAGGVHRHALGPGRGGQPFGQLARACRACAGTLGFFTALAQSCHHRTQAHTGAREAEGRDATRTTQWYVGRWGPRAD